RRHLLWRLGPRRQLLRLGDDRQHVSFEHDGICGKCRRCERAESERQGNVSSHSPSPSSCSSVAQFVIPRGGGTLAAPFPARFSVRNHPFPSSPRKTAAAAGLFLFGFSPPRRFS